MYLSTTGVPVFTRIKPHSNKYVWSWPEDPNASFTAYDGRVVQFAAVKAAVQRPNPEWARQSSSCTGDDPRWIFEHATKASGCFVKIPGRGADAIYSFSSPASWIPRNRSCSTSNW